MFVETVTGALSAFGVLAPSVQEARHAAPADSGLRRDLRIGEGLALAWGLVIAAYFATENNSPKPYLYWALASTAMVLTYELMLRSSPEPDTGCGCDGG
jgi:hypothetical protein